MLLRTLTSSLDSGAVAVNCIGWATSGSDFFRWRETAAAGIACTKKRNKGETKRERWLLRVESIVSKALFLYARGGRERPMIGSLLKKKNCLNYNLRIQELFRQEFGNRRSPFRLYTIGLHSFLFIYDSMSSLIPLILQNPSSHRPFCIRCDRSMSQWCSKVLSIVERIKTFKGGTIIHRLGLDDLIG